MKRQFKEDSILKGGRFFEKIFLMDSLQRRLSNIHDTTSLEGYIPRFQAHIEACKEIVETLPKKMLSLFPENFPLKYNERLLKEKAQKWLNHINLGIANFTNDLSKFVPTLEMMYECIKRDAFEYQYDKYNLEKYSRTRISKFVPFKINVASFEVLYRLQDDLLRNYLIEKELSSGIVEMEEFLFIWRLILEVSIYLKEYVNITLNNTSWFQLASFFDDKYSSELENIIEDYMKLLRLLSSILEDFERFIECLRKANGEWNEYWWQLNSEIERMKSFVIRESKVNHGCIELKQKFISEEEPIFPEISEMLFEIAILIIINADFPKRIDVRILIKNESKR